ncbi:MAG: DNA-directed RNA polymerase subunit beta [Chloroflexi bacterium]|nr:DNA-directed RNA polymerase subunit beta [Chloroflexota bacterium]|tara:strand:+ start:111 stop:4004 length:3894 start_codon:yes stop_codon:yes gene_type:complete
MVIADRDTSNIDNKKWFNRIENVVDVPNLLDIQTESFDWLKGPGILELIEEISPIEDFSGGRFEVRLIDHEIRDPELSEEQCRQREVTYQAPLYITVQLVIKETQEIKEQVLFFGHLPLMTKTGTFIINGAERVIVSQLVRSPGAYFTTETDPATGRELCSAKLIPYRGAWIELETSNKDIISVKVDRKRKANITTLLRAIGWDTDQKIANQFKNVDVDSQHKFIKATLAREGKDVTQDEALIEFYKRLRPGEPPSVENAKNLIDGMFFDPKKYDLGKVGRHKLSTKLLNAKIDQDLTAVDRTLTKEDIIGIISRLIQINNGQVRKDDIDHLGNRRVRGVGELIQNQIRVGLVRMERVVKERMSTQIDPSNTTPAALINIRPIVSALREFFGASQLSQFMDQTNPLAELTHKRRLSALGPGGLSRDRAGFDVRDVHHSHYGRICPIETPEGPNIGLLGSLSTFGRINEFGFIETPYRKVLNECDSKSEDIIGRIPADDVKDDNGKLLVESGKAISKQVFEEISKLSKRKIEVVPFPSSDVKDVSYMTADIEEDFRIGQATTQVDSKGQIVSSQVEVREEEGFAHETPENIDYMDVSPMQIVSVSTALIPFLEHDDANRALMGSNMQRQAVPCIRPQAPLVGTGMERRVAIDSGQVIESRAEGIVSSVNADRVIVTDLDGNDHVHDMYKYRRSNQGTCINQIPVVKKGQKVEFKQPLADSTSTDGAELSLGQNLTVAFMSWEGLNYEDSIVLNEDLVRNDRFTSVHIEKHDIEARDTKLGPEEITRDIPNVGEEALVSLDQEGIVRIGARVNQGDILVGKITPKGETELTAEEKLLRAIFGEKARDVKDSSLRVPHGQHGKVIDVKILTKENGDQLLPGVQKIVRVWIAHTRKITQGDKMAGRHGNKGVVSRVLPREDMPYLEDGTPIDIILNPIGVPSRMNLGQIMETHLGWAAKTLGFKARTPVFDGANDVIIEDHLARSWFVTESNALDKTKSDDSEINWELVDEWLEERGYQRDKLWSDAASNNGVARDACLSIWLKEVAGEKIDNLKPTGLMQKALEISREKKMSAPIFGKQKVFDGKTGIEFENQITVGSVYMMKLIHLVEDKIHARSTGPYSLITQQPLGGKAQFGGQRFGEMEVWALEAYSAAYTLQEMLTIKSDDVVGRVKTYEAIVKGEQVIQPGVPESFHVLLKELQGLGLSIELLNKSLAEELPQGTGPGSGEIDWNDMLDISDFEEDVDLETDDESEKVIDGEVSKVEDTEDNDKEEEIEISLPETESSSEEENPESEETEEEKN